MVESARKTRLNRAVGFVLFGLFAACTLSAADEASAIRVVNPFAPETLPGTLRVRLLGGDGKTLASLERKVEESFIRNIPSISGAEKIAVEAELFEETVTPLAAARESGVVLLPYGRVTIIGFVEESRAASHGDVRMWLRRLPDGKLIHKREPLGQSGGVTVRLPGGEWELVLIAPELAPVTSRFRLTPGAEIRHSVPRADAGIQVSLTLLDGDSKRPVPNAECRWGPVEVPALRDTPKGTAGRGIPSILSVGVNYDKLTTDASGRLLIDHLPPVSHSLTVLANGFRTVLEVVDIKANDRQSALTVRLLPSPDLLVRVHDRGALPEQLVVDIATRKTGGGTEEPFRPFWSGQIPLDSPKRFKRITDAEYRLDLKDRSGILQSRLWLSPAEKIWQLPEIKLTLTREPRAVTGRVTRGEEGAPGIYIFGVLESRSWPPEDMIPPLHLLLERGARSGPDGYYSLELGGPGVYKIGYTEPGAAINGSSDPVDLTTSLSAEVNLPLPPRALSIEVVSAETQEPVSGASLSIMLWKSPSQSGTSFMAETDQRGRYRNGSVSQEKASVTVSAPRFETKSMDLPIELSTAGADPARIELHPVSALRIRLSELHGIPVPGAAIWTLNTPGPGDVEPRLTQVAMADPTGLATIESPSSEPRPYFVLAPGYRLELVLAAGGEQATEMAVPLAPVEAAPAIRLRRSTGAPAVQSALAFLRFGLVYPWSLLALKVRQEGLDLQSTLTTGADGRIHVHELLAPGDYDVFLFAPADFQTRAQHAFAALGRLTLPIQTETTLTIDRARTKGGNP